MALMNVRNCSRSFGKFGNLIVIQTRAAQTAAAVPDSKKAVRGLISTPAFIGQALQQNRHSSSKIFNGESYFDEMKPGFIKLAEEMPSTTFPRRDSPKEAAVLVPLCISGGEPSVLFTLRSSYLASHKGDVSFPGGMKDLQDKSAMHNALREVQEEIGIPAGAVDIWTTMSPILSRNGKIWITPVVAFVGNITPEKCQVNSYEVDAVFTESLESLCCENNWRSTQYKIGYTLPVFFGSEHRIWGVTSMILHNVLLNLCPEFYKRKLKVNRMKTLKSKDSQSEGVV